MTSYTKSEIREYAEKVATGEVQKRGITDPHAYMFLVHYLILFRRFWFESHQRGDLEGYAAVVAVFYDEDEDEDDEANRNETH